MGDYMFDNMISVFMEAINFLVWFVPALCSFLGVILAPVIGLMTIGFLGIVRGWVKVSETLTEKWVDKAEDKGLVRYENLPLAEKIISFFAQATVITGMTLDIALVLFTIYMAVVMLSNV